MAEGPAYEASGLVHAVLEPSIRGVGHPAVVMLHGRGGDEGSMWIFASSLPADWLVVAPRAPLDDPHVGGYAWRRRAPDEWPPLDGFAPAVAALRRFWRSLPGLYGTDPARTFAQGFSQGAATAFAYAYDERAAVAGIASLVGFAPRVDTATRAAQPLAGLPVLMVEGARDELVPPGVADRSAADLTASGASVVRCRYDVGHKVSVAAMKDLAAWWRARAAGTGSAGG